jgi:glycosyltransferase involved in cell wall biosynthesis
MMLSCDYSQWKKLEITRLGVDTHSLLPEEFREHPEPLQLLCAGRLAAVKGQHVLLDAVRLLKEQCCPVHLHLAGDGEDRAALQNHVIATDLCDSVTFHGFLNQEKLRKLYAATDLFVLPSFAEGVPVVLMEAMALGIPCVATWVNGIPELIRNGIDGLTVAPGDAVGLANAIISCINDPRLRRQLSNAARLRATEIADLNRNVQHLAAIFAGYLRDDDAPEVAPDAADRQSAATAEYDKESVAELRR